MNTCFLSYTKTGTLSGTVKLNSFQKLFQCVCVCVHKVRGGVQQRRLELLTVYLQITIWLSAFRGHRYATNWIMAPTHSNSAQRYACLLMAAHPRSLKMQKKTKCAAMDTNGSSALNKARSSHGWDKSVAVRFDWGVARLLSSHQRSRGKLLNVNWLKSRHIR